jgi:hypothetical protein
LVSSLRSSPARSFADEAKASQMAEEVATNFARAVEAKDLDGLFKVVETPWLDGGKSVIKDRGQRKKLLEKKLSGASTAARQRIRATTPPSWASAG